MTSYADDVRTRLGKQCFGRRARVNVALTPLAHTAADSAVGLSKMGVVLQFRSRETSACDLDAPLDLLSAVDFALRDLSDIARLSETEAVRDQALACRQMLEAAYLAEIGQ